ncbi:hypothetical protein JIG36_10645 [Actinoplanes sp. LDG1-06]|uniref:Uncharacterized protein n=1 Tax=Paractinoplanes ovalisporus TaxID=2810368 RepID=A0ABS2A839_9ACTN|nr:hypothetical protein [Actinoplanes ovalisporus]MBM2616014.1 hypothetical protein [Actinoplanes ovalisporus]
MQPQEPLTITTEELKALIDAVLRVEIAVTRLELAVGNIRPRRAITPAHRTPPLPVPHAERVALRDALAANKLEMTLGLVAGIVALTLVIATLFTRTSI